MKLRPPLGGAPQQTGSYIGTRRRRSAVYRLPPARPQLRQPREHGSRLGRCNGCHELEEVKES
ncbi:hypothetical protein [Streptomyces qinglanensis]|uniref:hypothetical protein n=1 Tax=Streptomyces qinglanensis TaxID=943816 RepID=UPI003D726C78